MNLLRGVVLVCALVVVAPRADGARVLAYFGFSSQSHNNFYTALTTELANRGHDVTVVTAYPLKNAPKKNYRQIEATATRELFAKFNTVQATTDSVWTRLSKWRESADFFFICSKVLEMPEVCIWKKKYSFTNCRHK
jgi:hypothetical protein